MVSFVSAALRLIFKRKPQEGHIDEEHGHGVDNTPSMTGFGSNAMGSTLGGNTAYIPNHRSYRVPEEDPLVLFRLMVGISTSPYLGYSQSSPVGTRPAANIGIYSRVVHAEQKAKDSFKVCSILINACYFLQIVVAASLTAMGAAGVSHGAVTAFGAINTIIAGLLTFLKGSGLPGRLKYYGNEWKKIREFIEQRERDFSRAGCTLNVFEVVATVDRMYNNTKQEIEMNTPDTYNSVAGNLRFKNGSSEKVAGVDVSKLDGLVQKLTSGLESKAQDMTHRLQEQGKEVGREVRGLHRTAVETFEDKTTDLNREVQERSAQAAQAVDESRRLAMDEKDRIEQAGVQAARDIDNTHRTAVGEMRSAASEQMRRVADRLGNHHDSRHEEDKK
ncbi:hypothetical protein F4818DRAFT_92767 [Hypoxylon cercidicola]|nr:hypothetical protein F4818DRAFT_92767 [Hypoxylon cercidicola]